MEKVLEKQDIRGLTDRQLKDFMQEIGEKAFRTKQVNEWLWKKSATSFEEMTNLSLATREKLAEHFSFPVMQIKTHQQSSDGTVKYAFKLWDDRVVEGVLIPTPDRVTACVSSQVGCSLSCKFCATGYLKRMRNLEASEIYDQIVLLNKESIKYFDRPLSNIVFMGMGEPLLNYNNVMLGIERVTGEDGLNMASRRITLSTAGVAKMIRKLGDEEVKFNLALSLHAANDTKRNEIMPINESNSLVALRDALKHYFSKTKNPVTFEYCVFEGFNDSLQDAEELYRFTRHIPSKVNLIEYNPIDQADFKNTTEDRFLKFENYLTRKGVKVTVRRSRGKDIDAACGQLANKH
jgi:23S rRNA (adenine2503-C2)-methyltransferase